jgi:hypothetical protein
MSCDQSIYQCSERNYSATNVCEYSLFFPFNYQINHYEVKNQFCHQGPCLPGLFPYDAVYPEQFFTLMGSPFGAEAAFLASIYGATLVGNMLPCWFGLNAEKGTVRQAL